MKNRSALVDEKQKLPWNFMIIPFSHAFSLDLKRSTYPRVSDIIAKQTIEEMQKIPSDVLENACYRGTKVHEYCGAYLKGLWLPEIEEEYKPYVDAFIKWADENVSQTLFNSTRLYDDINRFTGEFDMIVELKGSKKVALVDIKTSANVSKTWAIQLAAYRHLCQLNGYNLESFFNIHLKKTKVANNTFTHGEMKMSNQFIVKASVIEHADLNPAWEIFSSALKCYDYFDRKEVE